MKSAEIIDQMQRQIDRAAAPEQMLAVAKAYLIGQVLRDMVAAEAWLMRVIEMEDAQTASEAMGLLAREILGRTEVLSDQDYLDILARVETASDSERQELLALLELGTQRQKFGISTEKRCKYNDNMIQCDNTD